MSLKARLLAEIVAEGPLRVDDYMLRCLWDPLDGYYARRPALGPEGDFVTAPQVSQMFGELLGLWAVQTWIGLGRPAPFRLAEIGPGDGTLIADALRAARVAPDFLAAAELVLVEPSRPLRALQQHRLADAPLSPTWLDDATRLPSDQPVIVLANEVLDCLPARQFVRTESGWAERRLASTDTQDIAFVLYPAPSGFQPPCDAATGQVVEVSAAQEGFAAALAALLAEAGGAALLIDYGRDRPEPGDTLQAVRNHARRDPLAAPGEDDLTVWADFPGVLAAARFSGAETAGPVPQGVFLRRLGLDARAARLARAAPEEAGRLVHKVVRLADPAHMGTLFKAVALYAPGTPIPPGFEEP